MNNYANKIRLYTKILNSFVQPDPLSDALDDIQLTDHKKMLEMKVQNAFLFQKKQVGFFQMLSTVLWFRIVRNLQMDVKESLLNNFYLKLLVRTNLLGSRETKMQIAQLLIVLVEKCPYTRLFLNLLKMYASYLQSSAKGYQNVKTTQSTRNVLYELYKEDDAIRVNVNPMLNS